MKMTRSETSPANWISWVTITMVRPSSASWRMTRSTSPISSGSSAEVASSNSMSFGCMASTRAMATRCCWPPESRSGYSLILWARPTFSSIVAAALLGLLARQAQHLLRRDRDIAECGQMRKQVEALEDEADLLALLGELAVAQMHVAAVDLLLADQRAVDVDVAGGRLLEIVDAAQQRRLARAARADDRDLLAARNVEADAGQHLESRRSACADRRSGESGPSRLSCLGSRQGRGRDPSRRSTC